MSKMFPNREVQKGYPTPLHQRGSYVEKFHKDGRTHLYRTSVRTNKQISTGRLSTSECVFMFVRVYM